MSRLLYSKHIRKSWVAIVNDSRGSVVQGRNIHLKELYQLSSEIICNFLTGSFSSGRRQNSYGSQKLLSSENDRNLSPEIDLSPRKKTYCARSKRISTSLRYFNNDSNDRQKDSSAMGRDKIVLDIRPTGVSPSAHSLVADHHGSSRDAVKLNSATERALTISHLFHQANSIPNIITMTRMLSSPMLSYWIFTDQTNFAIAGCCIAAISDFADGYLARNYNMSTTLGTYLDPLADKVVINVLSITLWMKGMLPSPLVALWFARDVCLIAGTWFAMNQNTSNALNVNPTTISKFNTGLQFLTVWIGIGQVPLGEIFSSMDQILLGFCWMSGGTTLLSGFSYLGYNAFSDGGNMGVAKKQDLHQSTKQ